jgi:putative FmdB family regulatory protein
MPMYDYKCSKCESNYSLRVSIDHYKVSQPCPHCGAENQKLFQPCTNHIFPGDGWSTKNERIKRQMRKKNAKLDTRSAEMKRETNVGGRLAPNVDGERVDSWSEAAQLAKSKGKNTDSYQPLIAKEKKG